MVFMLEFVLICVPNDEDPISYLYSVYEPFDDRNNEPGLCFWQFSITIDQLIQ